MSRPHPHLPTGALWARARRLTPARLGSTSDIMDLVDQGMTLAWESLNAAADAPLDWVRRNLLASYKALVEAWSLAVSVGLRTLGDAIHELADRVGAAFVLLARSLGEAMEAFLGVRPGHALLIGATVGVVLLGGGLYLATTPGGQAALPALVRLL